MANGPNDVVNKTWWGNIMDVDWGQIKWVWGNGGNLIPIASKFGITVPEITLEATRKGWGERGGDKQIVDFNAPILTDTQVILAHKTDLGRLRILAACVMEALQEETNKGIILKDTERLAKIYAIIIPLERKVFGLDAGDDDAPTNITINRGPRVAK
jgi:hypothetical protein